MPVFDAIRTRAVVKNTFIHIERVNEDFNERYLMKRRKSDALDIRHSAQSELILDVDFKTETSSRAAPQADLGAALSFAAVRPIVKNTFLHVEAMEENTPKSNTLRRFRRRNSDLLHARNADAESYKLEKQTYMSHGEDICGSESESSLTLSCASDFFSSVDSECSTNTGGSATVPQESEGSAGHSQGLCRPCVWFWRPTSCSKGSSCEYCHMCDEGAVARALASKKQMRKKRTKNVASK